MPVSVNMPGYVPKQEDPLDKIAKALDIVQAGFGIYNDRQKLEIAREQAKNETARRAQEDKKTGLEVQALERNQVNASEEDNPNSPMMATIRAAAKKRGVDIPAGTTPRQAKTNFDAFLKPETDSPLETSIKKGQLAKINRELGQPVLNEAEKKIVTDTATKYADTLAIKDSMDTVLGTLNDPNISYEQKMVAAQGALKLINSASLNSPDVVGAEEAKRAGAFINPSLKNALPGRAGPVFTPDLAAFTEQLGLMSTGLTDKAQKLGRRAAAVQGAPIKGFEKTADKNVSPAGHDSELNALLAEKAKRQQKNATAKK